ncbi:hypothetical protein CEXT_450491 [Caerostris extrusa]|uniref:Uncharacterized protein n=1 Tax=Caerostris extrusa TaxID=172846 RepID=A0AAV4NSL1_CAEEX|nr:hypothetical protein CEXT_450491 [Caerostris extrusa]
MPLFLISQAPSPDVPGYCLFFASHIFLAPYFSAVLAELHAGMDIEVRRWDALLSHIKSRSEQTLAP